MIWLWIALGAIVLIAAAVPIIAYACYRKAFYVKPRGPFPGDKVDLPEGGIYEPYWENMTEWILEVRAMSPEQVSITSFDGLTLRGRFYQYSPEAPIELMFHGYRGNAERDLGGAVQRCFMLGHSALIVNQRAAGDSEGHTITFGVKEHRDVLSWVDFVIRHYGREAKIILTGISMGASTVLTAAGKPLPDNVVGVLADCGFTSPKAIIQKVIRDMKLPVPLAYPFVWLGARVFGGFDLEAESALASLRTCKVPVIFFHGEADDYVPCDMSRENYEACTSRKRLVTVPNAGHGLVYLVAPELYRKEVRDFFSDLTNSTACATIENTTQQEDDTQ